MAVFFIDIRGNIGGLNQFSGDLIHLKGKNGPRIATNVALERVLGNSVNQSGVE